MDKELIKSINRNKYAHSIEDDLQETTVYKIEGSKSYILFWNSSNGEEPEFRYALPEIFNLIVDEKYTGTVSDGYNQIMYVTKKIVQP
tara:strand:+ start:24075 stop:24338 length:264 start_codon:yes stop_codon:yes gene_type:complete